MGSPSRTSAVYLVLAGNVKVEAKFKEVTGAAAKYATRCSAVGQRPGEGYKKMMPAARSDRRGREVKKGDKLYIVVLPQDATYELEGV